MKSNLIYQVFPKSFNGDDPDLFLSIINKLEYLSSLGIEYIWMCPIFKTSFVDAGYDIEDYYKVEETIGKEENLELLIQKSQKYGIKIILDIALNHTSNKHWWFENAINGDEKYQDYYIIKNKKNNWISSKTGKSVWSNLDPDGIQQYFHIYTDKQPDLNWNNKDVRLEMSKILNNWIGKGIAGFRLDVINKLAKPTNFQNLDEVKNPTLISDKEFEHNAQTFVYIKELVNSLSSKVLILGQVGGALEEHVVKYNECGVDLCLTFEQIDFLTGNYYTRSKAPIYKCVEYLNNIQKRQYPLIFLESHDAPRIPTTYVEENKYKESITKLLASVLLLSNGYTIIYQGQELGADNIFVKSIDELSDIRSKDYYKKRKELGHTNEDILKDFNKFARDQARNPIIWDNDKWNTIEEYKLLISIRKKYKLNKGSIQNIKFTKTQYYYEINVNNNIICFIINFSNETIENKLLGEVIYSNQVVDKYNIKAFQIICFK